MSIEVTLRHTSDNEGIKKYAWSRAEKILSQFPKVDSIHVVLDEQRHLHEAEFIVHQKGLTAIGAKERADSFATVIDSAAASAEKQLKKQHDKKIDAHHGAGAKV
ncbi:MAG: HPF/RaiA family ribosome-associated protein [Kiritimatiellia bacterium]